MDKRKIVDLLIEKLQAEAQSLIQAARAAHEAATHEESRAEDQHDTRGLEASYLAGAQAQRAADLHALISAYRMMPLKELGPQDPIAPGALVELRLEGARASSYYFMVPRGGGTLVQCEGAAVQVIAPQSPMGESLVGRRGGELIELETRDSVREYEIVAVR